MVIQFTVYPSARLVQYTVKGATTDVQADAFLASVLAHPRFEPGFDFLGECRDPDEAGAVYPPTLARAVRSRATEFGPCRWAVVVPTAHGEALVRRWAELMPPHEVDVAPFLTHSAAIDWLADAGPE